MNEPSIQFLAHAQRKPRLRLLDPVSGDESAVPQAPQEFPVPDSLIVRDGWLAINQSDSLWSIPWPLRDEAILIARSFDAQPGLDGRSVWAHVGTCSEGEDFAPLGQDGVPVSGCVRFPTGSRLDAVIPEGWVTRIEKKLQLRTRRGDCENLGSGWVAGSHGSTLIVDRMISGSGKCLEVISIDHRRTLKLAHPDVGSWGMFPSFAPDGKHFAIEFQYAHVRLEGNSGSSASEDWHGMALVDSSTGSVKLFKGRFLGFATRPAWSTDGSLFAFSAPFDKLKLLSAGIAESELHMKTMKKTVSKPLVDIDARARC